MTERVLRFAVEIALDNADADARDMVGRALIRRYASDIDEAARMSVSAAKLARDCQPYLAPALYSRLLAQLGRIEETHVLATLGPKLLQALVELGLTPRARAGAGTAKGGGSSGSPRDELALWRAARFNTS